jgi:hypothetical protein
MRAVGVVLLLAVGAMTAHAEDPLAEAKRLEAALDYNAALIIVDRTIAQGGATRDELVVLHLFAGKLAAGLDRAEVAQDHFARALALAPTSTFPEGTSPKITEPFDAARTRTVPLRVTETVERGAIAITAGTDPLGLVVGIAVTLDGGNELREPRALRVALPDGARATEVSALDAYGNRVWSASITERATPSEAATTLRPLYARWPLWASTAAVALAAGGVCAWKFDSAQDEWDRGKADGLAFSRLEAIEDRGRRWGLAANISFGVAAASAIVAIVTAARGSTTEARDATTQARDATTTAIVSANPDGVGLAIVGGF